MAEHTSIQHNLEERYSFVPEFRKKLLMGLGLGVLFLIVGAVCLALGIGSGHHEAHATGHEVAKGSEHGLVWLKRIWANLWINNVYFTGISIIGLFFVAVQYVANAGWATSIKRIPESFASFLPFTGIMMLIIFFAGGHDLFHWTHANVYELNGAHYDKLLDDKKAFFFAPLSPSSHVPLFFIIRMIAYFLLWIGMHRILKRESQLEDLEGGLTHYQKSIKYSAIFLIIFAVTSSTSAWDWVMSVNPHWFSTMFGWYVFASWFVAGLATITLVVTILKEKGYLALVNESHLHDLGKFMFAFSIFWTYIWFCQFLLIYYANIPEETIYFKERLEGYNHVYTPLIFINLFLNFLFPFLVLMTRDAKRKVLFLKIVAVAILVGHWLDFYVMIMPETVGANGSFGFIEIGGLLIYVSAFMFIVATTLSKSLLVAKNHPLLQESLHHDI